MRKNLALYTLQTFSSTGGIQKMTRSLAHSLLSICKKNNWLLKMISLYDANSNLMPRYISKENFLGYQFNRTKFIKDTFIKARKIDVVILTHINLALVGIITKFINPKSKLYLIAHGIEIWRNLPPHKQYLLRKCDKIVCVSEFTRQQVINNHGVKAAQCVVLNNPVDPFMKFPKNFNKPVHLLKRYNLSPTDTVIFTLTRLASSEQYKGHDMVIRSLNNLKAKFPDIKYILAGKHDDAEELRVKKLIADNGAEGIVTLTGFIDETELTDHFLLADLFVLPSRKEGFGIVFIEALACGLPVICGNADGSIDAILNGELGTAIDPSDQAALEIAIVENLTVPLTTERRKFLQHKCLQSFNEQQYIDNFDKLLTND